MDIKYTHVFAVPGELHIIDTAIPADQNGEVFRGGHSGETLAEITIRYPGARLYDFDDWQIVASERQRTPIAFTLTTRERYHEMLEVLPPAFWHGGLFCVGEPTDHDIATGQPRFAAYWQKRDQYFAVSRPITIAEARILLSTIAPRAFATKEGQ